MTISLRQINIDQQMAEIGIRSTPAKMKITHPRLTMRVKSETPRMQVESTMPKFRVNRKKLNADMNIHMPSEFTKKHRDMGKNAVLKGIKTSGDDGDFLGDVRGPGRGKKIAQLARNKTMTSVLKKKDANIGLLPKEKPEIIWEKGSLSINWSKQSLVIDWDGDYLPQLTIDPKYNVELYLRTEPYFRITVEEPAGTTGTGKYINGQV